MMPGGDVIFAAENAAPGPGSVACPLIGVNRPLPLRCGNTCF